MEIEEELRKIEKTLSKEFTEKSDKELREICKETKEEKKAVRDSIRNLERKLQELKDLRNEMEWKGRQVRLCRGFLKAKVCPVLVKNGFYWRCGARESWIATSSLERLIERFCSTCRLTLLRLK